MCTDAEDRVDDTNTANTKLSTKFVDRNLSTGVEDTSLRGESAVRSPVTAQHSTAQHTYVGKPSSLYAPAVVFLF